jgi:hypothetical protein
VEGSFVLGKVLSDCDFESLGQCSGLKARIIRLRFIGLESNFVGFEKAAVENVLLLDVLQS